MTAHPSTHAVCLGSDRPEDRPSCCKWVVDQAALSMRLASSFFSALAHCFYIFLLHNPVLFLPTLFNFKPLSAVYWRIFFFVYLPVSMTLPNLVTVTRPMLQPFSCKSCFNLSVSFFQPLNKQKRQQICLLPQQVTHFFVPVSHLQPLVFPNLRVILPVALPLSEKHWLLKN